jgi:hypothetical protein
VCVFIALVFSGSKRELKKRKKRTESRSNRNASSVEEQRSADFGGSFYRESSFVRAKKEISVKYSKLARGRFFCI